MNLPSPRLLMAALSEDRQDLLQELYDEHRQGVRAAMRERRQARREVRKLMLASEFEPERIDQAFAVLRDSDEKAAAAVQSMLMELLSQLTPEERAKVAELVPQHRRHRHRPPREGGEDRPRREQAPAEAAAPDSAAGENQSSEADLRSSDAP